jgi:glycyl-tRNA synthetase
VKQWRVWFERLFKGNYVPHVIEPSAGLDRMALAVLAKAFVEEEKADVNGKVETRTILRLHPRVAPIKVGVFPLLKNKPELVAKAREVYALLKKHMNCFYDETAAIGRRYARQDEAGTPFGVTIDFETLGEENAALKDTVTLRHRDSGEQERVPIADLLARLQSLVG